MKISRISLPVIMTQFIILLWLGIILQLPPTAEAKEVHEADILLIDKDVSDFTLRGSYKNLFTYFTTDNYWDEKTNTYKHKRLFADLNRIRLSPEIKISENVFLHADIDNEVIAANYTNSRTFDGYWSPSTYNDLYDADIDHSFHDHYVYRFNLHRLFAKIVTGNFTITLGRQQIRFGSGRLWNPLDILNPISPTFIEGAEDQKGTDAVRLEYYPGISTEIAIVYAPKRTDDKLDGSILANQNTNAVCRIRTTMKDTDIALLGGRVTQRNLGGIDIATILWDGILRGSLLVANPDHAGAYLLGSAGYEYTFKNRIYFLAEYFYNQNAINHNSTLSAAFSESTIYGLNEDRYSYLANQFITFNRHYCAIALGYDISPLLHGDIFTIADIEGRGLYFSPVLRYNLLENLDVSVTAMMGIVFENAPYASDFSEFEDYPLISATLIRYF
ncbi:MAG: hypothetical protein JW786_01050 [Desulfobacterales bacterium]|nr:hypothetical protein [Desulfobacterales bacterium]